MKISKFNASFNSLWPLFNMEKCGRMHPHNIRHLLEANMDLLVSAIEGACQDNGTPKSDFLYDLVYTCKRISKELEPADRSEDFGEWELFMNECSNHDLLKEDSNFVLPEATKPVHREKHQAEQELQDQDTSGDKDPDAHFPGRDNKASSSISATAKNSKPKSSTKLKFKDASTIKEVADTTTAKVQPHKQIKTQTGSVKEEPSTAKGESSHATRAQVHATVKDEGDTSMSKGKGKATVEIEPLSTYYYIEKVPMPVHKDEYQSLLKAPPMPLYGLGQTLRCLPDQEEEPMLFAVSWHYLLRPLLSVFESTANAAAQASLHYRSELYEALHIAYNAIRSEGADTLKGIVFQDPDILAKLKTVLDMFDNPKPSVAKLPVKELTPPPVHHSKPGPSKSSKFSQQVEVTLHSSGEESNSDSHSSVVGSLLEPLGHNSDSDQNLSAPVPDPDALVDELAADPELHDMNQDLEPELWVVNSPWRTCKKKLPKKHRSAAHL
ncbi:hypothetical protein ARMGADRAFT_1036754 [Armillaria gallica]|uniref:Uncharacterized protein n=1 Tax=Armillaria gallica TaxID=47427 RepID=A0A2H3DBE2_ARMGA|nr:hypothetical protein ARMGADRAFT_1036754 [Armillaria gallica]